MIKKKILLDIYKTFSLIRASQNELISTYHPENKMRCPIHFCQGQEALASVAKIFLEKMITCYPTIDLMDIISQKVAL